MELYTHEQMLDEVLGLPGTPLRDHYERATQEFSMELAQKHIQAEKVFTPKRLPEKVGLKPIRVALG